MNIVKCFSNTELSADSEWLLENSALYDTGNMKYTFIWQCWFKKKSKLQMDEQKEGKKEGRKEGWKGRRKERKKERETDWYKRETVV